MHRVESDVSCSSIEIRYLSLLSSLQQGRVHLDCGLWVLSNPRNAVISAGVRGLLSEIHLDDRLSYRDPGYPHSLAPHLLAAADIHALCDSPYLLLLIVLISVPDPLIVIASANYSPWLSYLIRWLAIFDQHLSIVRSA